MKTKTYNAIRGIVILLLVLSFSQNIYLYFKYNEALDSLLICTTSKYGKVDNRIKEVVEKSGLRETINNNNNNITDKRSLLQEVNNSILSDLEKRAEKAGVTSDELKQDIIDSGFKDEIKVKNEPTK